MPRSRAVADDGDKQKILQNQLILNIASFLRASLAQEIDNIAGAGGSSCARQEKKPLTQSGL